MKRDRLLNDVSTKNAAQTILNGPTREVASFVTFSECTCSDDLAPQVLLFRTSNSAEVRVPVRLIGTVDGHGHPRDHMLVYYVIAVVV